MRPNKISLGRKSGPLREEPKGSENYETTDPARKSLDRGSSSPDIAPFVVGGQPLEGALSGYPYPTASANTAVTHWEWLREPKAGNTVSAPTRLSWFALNQG